MIAQPSTKYPSWFYTVPSTVVVYTKDRQTDKSFNVVRPYWYVYWPPHTFTYISGLIHSIIGTFAERGPVSKCRDILLLFRLKSCLELVYLAMMCMSKEKVHLAVNISLIFLFHVLFMLVFQEFRKRNLLFKPDRTFVLI